MLKFLLIGVLVVWLLYSPFLRRKRKGQAKAPAPPPAPKSITEDMVQCAHCGIHLPASEAQVDSTGHAFCSTAHRQAGPRPH